MTSQKNDLYRSSCNLRTILVLLISTHRLIRDPTRFQVWRNGQLRSHKAYQCHALFQISSGQVLGQKMDDHRRSSGKSPTILFKSVRSSTSRIWSFTLRYWRTLSFEEQSWPFLWVFTGSQDERPASFLWGATYHAFMKFSTKSSSMWGLLPQVNSTLSCWWILRSKTISSLL